MRRRNKSINIRFSEEEYTELKKLVLQSGQTLQKYIIDAVLKGRITSAEEVAEMINRNKILADIDRQLRGMGTNLNQMAHVANGQGKIPSADKLAQIANEVGKIKSEVDEQWQFLRQSISQQRRTEL